MPVPAESIRLAKRGRVLVIDDEPLLVELFKRILRRNHDVFPGRVRPKLSHTCSEARGSTSSSVTS